MKCRRVRSFKMLQSFRKFRFSSLLKSRLVLFVLALTIGYMLHLLLFYDLKKDLSASLYMSSIPKFSNADTFLVVLILSSINNFSRRQVLRDTWVADALQNSDVKHFFVMSTGNAPKEQKNLLAVEQSSFNDLLIFPNLDDSFYTLTSKLLTAFEWVVGTRQDALLTKPFGNFKFLLKCDDDSFVRVNEIVDELKTKFSGDKGKYLYWGFFDGRARAKNSGKYKEIEWNICDHYIPYALGGGYLLSQPLVDYLVLNEKYLKKYKNEDVTVGAWLANYANINRVHDPRFDTEYVSRGCHRSYLITHKHSEAVMRTFHNNLQNFGHLCQNEFKTRMSYIYNWDVPPSKCCSRVNPSIP